MTEIKIKAWFSDWKEVSFEKAVNFSYGIMSLHKPEVFNNHFQGITYEEIMDARQKRT